MNTDPNVIFSVICLGLVIVSTCLVGVHIFWKADIENINEGKLLK